MHKAFILFLAIMLGACSQELIKPIEQNDKIVAIGDSLTYGYGGDGTAYPEELGKIIKRRVINEGLNGDTSNGVLARIDSVVEKHGPSYVILAIGGNDMLRGLPDETITQNIESIIDHLQDKTIQVILVAQPRPKAVGLVFNLVDAPFYKSIAKKKNVVLVENVFSSLLNNASMKSDLIHLNAKGYSAAAQEVAKQLNDKSLIAP